VGATAAPSTQAGPHANPSPCATTATTPAVASTNPVASNTIGRRLLRISRSDVVKLSQYSSAGRNSSSMTSGGRLITRNAGTNPSNPPHANSNTGAAIRNRPATALLTITQIPSATTSSKPSNRTLPTAQSRESRTLRAQGQLPPADDNVRRLPSH